MRLHASNRDEDAMPHIAIDYVLETPYAAQALAEDTPLPLRILLVEDNTSDAALTSIALDETNIPYTLHRLNKGTDVLPYLMQQGMLSADISPDLILLDLGLPCQDGFEILAEIATLRGAIRGIPIVILTGYEHFAYLKHNSQLCITDYLTKPCDTGILRRILKQLR
jgi:CheY-like chemotaxis protein